MTISPRFLDELRSRLTLSDMIGRRVKVIRAGREFKACCPFHREKTPSFTINDDKQFYHCFGCGAHGDVVNFFMNHDNLSFIDTVEMLCAEAGLTMPQPDPDSVRKAEKTRDLNALMDAAADYFTSILQSRGEGETALRYLLERGLTPETLQAFRIGFAPADGQALRKALLAEGYKDAQMIEAGLLKPSSKSGGQPYGFFRDRVMFPVSDRRGRIVAFGGRVLPDHLRPPRTDGFTPPKYMNSADTPLFDKGRTLYGESLARQAARAGHTILVAEGYMDVIACHQAGFKGAVAPMGTALTEEQILLLWSMNPEREKSPVLCFDGDKAGRSAAARACERILPLLKPDQSARFAFMPEGEDPDSLIRTGGPQALKEILRAAMPLFDFLWVTHTAGRRFETPESRAGLKKALMHQISHIADSDVQNHYRALAHERIMQAFFPRQETKKARNDQKRGGSALPARPKNQGGLKLRRPVKDGLCIQDSILLAAIMNYPAIYEGIEDSFGRFTPAAPRLDALRQQIIVFLDKETGLDAAALRSMLCASGFEQECRDILSESVYVHAAFCRPGTEAGEVEALWRDLWRERERRDVLQEVRDGRKEAFRLSSTEEEDRLKSLHQAGAGGAE
ncbi:MAG: DNA primase [Alphaproteobacteria bacterium]